MTDSSDDAGSGYPIERRDVIKAGAGIPLLAGVTSQSAAAQSASGPTVYVGDSEGGDNPDGTLYAVDAVTGSQEWAFPAGGTVQSSRCRRWRRVEIGLQTERSRIV